MRTQLPGKQILDSSVETSDLLDGAVTEPKLSDTGVTGGTYNKVVVSAKGRVTSATLETTLAGVGITDAQPLDADLTAFAALGTNGLVIRSGEGAVVTRTLVAPAAGLTITNPDGVANAPTFALANDLAALEGLASTGIATRVAVDTWVTRTILGTAGTIVVTSGTGVAGNPTIDLADAGTAGTYGSATSVPVITTDAKGRVTSVVSTPITFPPASVTSVFTRTGDVVAVEGDYTLDLLGDVSTTGAANGMVLTFSAGTWAPAAVAPAPVTSVFSRVGVVSAVKGDYVLDLLGDVLLTAPAAGEVLQFNGTLWANTVPTLGTVTSVDITPPVAGISVSGGPITSSGTFVLTLANDLAGIEGLTGTGFSARTGADLWAVRTITGTVANISVTNGSGSTGNPTIDLADAGTPGTYGDTLTVPVLTTDAKGRVVTVVETAITFPVTTVFGRSGAVVAAEGDYSLDLLSDVTLTAPATGDLLRFNGAEWVNSTPPAVVADPGANGFVVRTALNVSAARTLIAGTGVSISNGDGVITNPVITNTGVVSLAGTSNQVLVSAATGAVTLSTPQDIHTGATPSFAQVTVGADPVSAQQVATKQYVDNFITGLDFKPSAIAATTAAITLATPPAVIDGVTLTEGDRILVKNQAAGAENGIYTYSATGLVRVPDADEDVEVTAGLYVFVTDGTLNADSGWVLSTPDPIVVDTTPLAFVQFTGLGQVAAGAGLTKTGNQLDVVTADVGRIVVNPDSIDLALAGSAGTHGSAISVPTFTTDAYGRVTAVTPTSIAFPVTTVFGRTGNIVATEGDYSLDQLSNVAVTTAVPDQVLTYNGSTWVPTDIPSPALDDLTDVTLTTPAIGHVLTFNGSEWVDAQPTGTWGLITGDMTNQSDLDTVLTLLGNVAVSTGVTTTTDSAGLTPIDDFTVQVNEVGQAIFHDQLGQGIENAIRTFPQQVYPLANLGITVDGLYIRYFGYGENGVLTVTADSQTNNPGLLQVGYVMVKVNGGVTSFIDGAAGPRNAVSQPEFAGNTELLEAYAEITSDVFIQPNTNLTLRSTEGVVKGESANWGGADVNVRPIPAEDPLVFGIFNPGTLASGVFPSASTNVQVNQYWNGTAMVNLGNNRATVQRILISLRGNALVQVGEVQYNDLDTAVDNINFAPFTTIFPAGTTVEVCRFAVEQGTTNLSTQAVFAYAGGGGGGASAGAGTVVMVEATSTSPGLTIVGSPITTSGTLEFDLVPFTSSTEGIVPASGGGTTNFLRADGTWASTSASTGTVTSVNVAGGTTGLTFVGGPVTTAGTITAGGTLAITSGGTGQTTASAALNALLPAQTGLDGAALLTDGTAAYWGQPTMRAAQLFNYNFGTVTTPPPANGTIRYNTAGQTTATQVFVDASTGAPATDLTNYYRKITPNTVLWVQARNDADQFQQWFITAVAEDVANSYFTWTIQLLSSGGAAFTNNQQLTLGYVFAGGQPESIALTDLSDVTVSAPATNQVLQFNGTQWVNAAAAGTAPGGATTNVQYNNAGAFGGDPAFNFVAGANPHVAITGTVATNQLRVGGSAQVGTATLYIESNNASQDGLLAYFNSGTPASSALISYAYNGSQPIIRVVDGDDDPTYIEFSTVAAIGQTAGTFAAPSIINRFGSRGPNANGTTGFAWSVSASGSAFTTIAELDSQFLRIPSGTTAQRPGTPTAGMTRFNTTTSRTETYTGTAWVPSGSVIQTVVGTVAKASSNLQIPYDTSIPTSGEGFQLWTQSFTPILATSRILITTNSFFIINSAADVIVSCATFNGTTNINAQVLGFGTTSGAGNQYSVTATEISGSTAARTYSFRAGPNSGVTVFYGQGVTATFGAAVTGTFIIQEIAV